MASEDSDRARNAPMPQSIAIVAIATLGCLAVAYMLWGFVSFSAGSMHDVFGEVALPLFTGKLIQSRGLFWALPIVSLLGGGSLVFTEKHSLPNLLVYVAALVFAVLTAMAFTFVSLALPWVRVIVENVRQ